MDSNNVKKVFMDLFALSSQILRCLFQNLVEFQGHTLIFLYYFFIFEITQIQTFNA